jgi:uncharacterized protein
MRWRDTKASKNVHDYRGRSTGGGGRGMSLGIGGIVVLVAGYFLGIDPRLLMGLVGGGTGTPQAEAPVEASTPGDEQGQFVQHVLGDTEETWHMIFSQAGRQYPEAQLSLFSEAINTGCGHATAAVGPFYCPADGFVYIDLVFFRQLETEFAAQGDFARAYVIAHEVGHHVQNVTGIAKKVHEARAQLSQEDANALQVKMELQADCYAGIWAHYADRARGIVEAGDIDEALGAAGAVGDDTIQKRTTGEVNQESFTHGSAAQRVEWFKRGLSTGQVASCDTFK